MGLLLLLFLLLFFLPITKYCNSRSIILLFPNTMD
eukprot:UN05576